jgi:hypothetical protein
MNGEIDVRRVLLAAGAASFLAGCAVIDAAPPDSSASREDRRGVAEAVVGRWSNSPAMAARALIEKHGVPDEVHAEDLVWYGAGAWSRTVVRDVDPDAARGEGGDLGMIEQTLDVDLTPSQAADVVAFDPRADYDPEERTLTVRSDREELNTLRMNLAHDVIVGKLSPERARASFQSIVSYEESGKNSPSLQDLQFDGSLEEGP